MSAFPLPLFAASPSHAITLTVDGAVYAVWTRGSIKRDLSDLAGSFTLECHDLARATQALPDRLRPLRSPTLLRCGQAAEIAIDGEPWLRGWIEDVVPVISGSQIGVSISGRDVTGDLIDCAAAPLGPVEYRDIRVEDFIATLCEPFGITVRAEVDTGEKLKKISIDAAETVMSASEKVTRKRGLLIVSDGVGGILLTRSGATRAPGAIVLGGNVTDGRGQFSHRNRFSDVFVKGQIEGAAGKRRSTATLDATAEPLTSAPPAGDGDAPTGRESRALAIQGHARDAEVTRWRPTVKQVRAASLKQDAQMQAEWTVANARGASETVHYQLPGFRTAGALWRPNTMTFVTDPWQDIAKDLLVAGVELSYGERGSITQIRVTGKEAYETLEDGGEGSDIEDGVVA